eukprot:1880601-Lingulodinium_polyedra.AAC.1
MKSGNEPALVVVMDGASRGAQRANMENSPVYSSKSNGVIEKGGPGSAGDGEDPAERPGGEAAGGVGRGARGAGVVDRVRGVAGQPSG